MIKLIILLIVVGIPIWVFVKIIEFFQETKEKSERIAKKKKELDEKFKGRIADKTKSLEARNEDIIQEHLNKLDTGYHRYYYIENSVRDCIDDIANAEGDYGMAPGYEYLSNWVNRANSSYLQLKDSLIERFKNNYEELKSKEEDNKNNEIQQEYLKLRKKHEKLIHQFFEIAERKVSIIDDYGDECWDALPKEIDILIKKIGKDNGHTDKDFKDWEKYDFNFPDEFKMLKDNLFKEFREYHDKEKDKPLDRTEFNDMSGIEFETYLSKLFKKHGYQVSGTPSTGDQGADLIVKKDGKTIIIQAKRHANCVGNKAVQEVASAVKFYQGDEGWVITNSTFTPSAKALSQKNRIILVDGHQLKRLEGII